MPMEIKWTDIDGDEIALTEYNDHGEKSEHLWLFIPGRGDDEAVFTFDNDDAESFADALRSWALRQREGK